MNKAKTTQIGLALCVSLLSWFCYTQVKAASLNQALCIAASKGETATVERLLARGANPNAVGSIGDTECNCEDNPSPAPALILAIYQTSGDTKEHFDTVAALLQSGANVNARADQDMTALMWATSPRMTSYLLAHGADVHLKDDHGDTALSHQNMNPKIIRLLRQAGAM
jgi:ankyrin repeat protein